MNRAPYLGYTVTDFHRYFGDAYVRMPGNKLVQIAEPAGNDTFVVVDAMTGNTEKLDVSKIRWSDVYPASLGYTRDEDGIVYHVSRRPGRNTHKGIADRLIYFGMAGFEVAVRNAKVTTEKRRQALYNLYYPKYPSYREAKQLLAAKNSILGAVLSPQVCICVDPYDDAGFWMFISEKLVGATNKNGRWEFNVPYAADVARRLGVGDYV